MSNTTKNLCALLLTLFAADVGFAGNSSGAGGFALIDAPLTLPAPKVPAPKIVAPKLPRPPVMRLPRIKMGRLYWSAVGANSPIS